MFELVCVEAGVCKTLEVKQKVWGTKVAGWNVLLAETGRNRGENVENAESQGRERAVKRGEK